MSTPTPDQLAPMVPPMVRAYIDAVMGQHRAQLEAKLAALEAALAEHAAQTALAPIQAQLNDLKTLIGAGPASDRKLQRLKELLEKDE